MKAFALQLFEYCLCIARVRISPFSTNILITGPRSYSRELTLPASSPVLSPCLITILTRYDLTQPLRPLAGFSNPTHAANTQTLPLES